MISNGITSSLETVEFCSLIHKSKTFNAIYIEYIAYV